MSLEYIDWDIGDVTVINLSGRITLGEGTSRVRAAVREALARGRKNLLLNLHDVFYLDSSGLGELVTLHTTVRKAGGHLKLMKLNELTRNLLTVSKLYTVFETFADEQSALESFAAERPAANPESGAG
ncbi:MAG TPA: STAS domain-containing protein [Bryobacteraceae bacterium]|jgi:anti-sigma B factor antagonist|nr:STAS domain-containing protein [Bryobacteraceae bacterium]